MPVFLAVFLVLGSVFLGTLTQAATLRLIYPKAPVSLDPHHYPVDSAAIPIIMNTYKRLVDLAPDSAELSTKNSLAHTIRVSDDGLMYTVVLKEGQTFTDGEQVNSKAALFTFDRLMQSEAGQHFFPYLRGFEPLSDHNFRLILDRPWPPFMAALALPQASLISPGLAGKPADFLKNKTLGTGRLEVDSFEGQSLVLGLRKDYYGQPAINRVEFYYEADKARRWLLFLEKAAHVVIEPKVPEKLPETLIVKDVPTWETRFVAFNFLRPYMRIDGVRQALVLLAKSAFQAEKIKPRGMFPAGFFKGEDGDKSLAMVTAEERAMEILAGVGPSKFPLSLVYHAEDPDGHEDASRLAGVMAKYGLSVNLVPLTGAAGAGILEKADYDILLDSRNPEIPSPEMWLGRFLDSRSQGAGNSAFFKESRADAIIDSFADQGPRSDTWRLDRLQKIKQLTNLASATNPYALLYQKSLLMVIDRRLEVLALHPMWPDVWPLENMEIDPFKDRQKKMPTPGVVVDVKEPVRNFDELVVEPHE